MTSTIRSLYQWLILSCVFSISITANAADNSTMAQTLFKTINQRLSYMEDVALYKAQNQLAIENIKREVVVLNGAKKAASKQGLNADRWKDFLLPKSLWPKPFSIATGQIY
ncbi:MAG: chorismate mutase [Phenylobacterium sp.]|jgi:chorismate mutase